MATLKCILGGLIVLAVLGGLFAATASRSGFWNAVGTWAASLAITALLVLGLWLLVGSP